MDGKTLKGVLLIAAAVALASGCGPTRVMRPQVAQAGPAARTATSCVGDVCLHYADDVR